VGFDQILGFARDNDAAAIREIVKMGCPPSFTNRVGQTPLHIAAIWGSVEAAQALLELGANPNAANQLRGSTPLHAAALGKGPPERRAECVRLMIQAKGDPRQADLGGELPLDCASDEAVRLALGAAPLILHKAVESRCGLEALAQAIKQVQSGAVDLTLETMTSSGESALHLAVALGWREGVQMLLAARADPCTQNSVRREPLHTAVLQGNHRIVQLLLDARANPSARDSDPEHDPRFTSKSVEETPDEHRTPLHYAAELGNVIAARLLLQKGCVVDAPESRRLTALHLCLALRADTELEVGCGVKVTGLQKKPEWNGRLGSVVGPKSASDAGTEERWPVLLEGEDSPDGVLLKADNLTRLPEESLDLLLEARADVNLGNTQWGEGRTVLHEAAHLGDLELARKVLAAGAEVDRQDKKLGFSALHLASRAKKDELVRLLVNARADIHQPSAGGKTAAELGEINGLSEAALALLQGKEVGEEPKPAAKEPTAGASGAQTLDSLTAEQKALLFID